MPLHHAIQGKAGHKAEVIVGLLEKAEEQFEGDRLAEAVVDFPPQGEGCPGQQQRPVRLGQGRLQIVHCRWEITVLPIDRTAQQRHTDIDWDDNTFGRCARNTDDRAELDAEHAAPVLPMGVARFVDAAAALIRTSANTLITAMLAQEADVVQVSTPLHGVSTIEDARALPLCDPARLAMTFVARRPNEITTFRDGDGSIRTVVVQAGKLAKA